MNGSVEFIKGYDAAGLGSWLGIFFNIFLVFAGFLGRGRNFVLSDVSELHPKIWEYGEDK